MRLLDGATGRQEITRKFAATLLQELRLVLIRLIDIDIFGILWEIVHVVVVVGLVHVIDVLRLRARTQYTLNILIGALLLLAMSHQVLIANLKSISNVPVLHKHVLDDIKVSRHGYQCS